MARVLVTRRLPDGGTEPLITAGHEIVARDDDTPFSHAELCEAVRVHHDPAADRIEAILRNQLHLVATRGIVNQHRRFFCSRGSITGNS